MVRLFLILIFYSTFLNAQEDKMIKTTNGDFSIIDKGKGTPVLLLHGFPDSKELWEYQIPVLANAGFRVIAPDLRGYGNSPSPIEKEKYTMPILMNDVIGILDALKLDKVHIIGHDWGAALSWNLVNYYEHRFNSLSALSVGFPGNPAWLSEEQRQRSSYIKLFLQEGIAEKTLSDNDWKFTKEAFASHKQFDDVLQRLKKPNALTTGLNWYRGNLQNFFEESNVESIPSNQKKIQIPVLGIWSTMDMALTEAQMKLSADYVANFTYKKIEEAGHWLMLDRPKEINSLLLSFLSSTE